MGMSLFRKDYRDNNRILMLLVAASIPGAIIGLAFEKQAETVFRSPLLVAIALASLGVVLWVSDRVALQKRTIREITFLDAILIGLSQALAIVPGVSRSGASLTIAM